MIWLVNLFDFPEEYLPEEARLNYAPTDVATFHDVYLGIYSIIQQCMGVAGQAKSLGFSSLGDEGRVVGKYPLDRVCEFMSIWKGSG